MIINQIVSGGGGGSDPIKDLSLEYDMLGDPSLLNSAQVDGIYNDRYIYHSPSSNASYPVINLSDTVACEITIASNVYYFNIYEKQDSIFILKNKQTGPSSNIGTYLNIAAVPKNVNGTLGMAFAFMSASLTPAVYYYTFNSSTYTFTKNSEYSTTSSFNPSSLKLVSYNDNVLANNILILPSSSSSYNTTAINCATSTTIGNYTYGSSYATITSDKKVFAISSSGAEAVYFFSIDGTTLTSIGGTSGLGSTAAVHYIGQNSTYYYFYGSTTRTVLLNKSTNARQAIATTGSNPGVLVSENSTSGISYLVNSISTGSALTKVTYSGTTVTYSTSVGAVLSYGNLYNNLGTTYCAGAKMKLVTSPSSTVDKICVPDFIPDNSYIYSSSGGLGAGFSFAIQFSDNILLVSNGSTLLSFVKQTDGHYEKVSSGYGKIEFSTESGVLTIYGSTLYYYTVSSAGVLTQAASYTKSGANCACFLGTFTNNLPDFALVAGSYLYVYRGTAETTITSSIEGQTTAVFANYTYNVAKVFYKNGYLAFCNSGYTEYSNPSYVFELYFILGTLDLSNNTFSGKRYSTGQNTVENQYAARRVLYMRTDTLDDGIILYCVGSQYGQVVMAITDGGPCYKLSLKNNSSSLYTEFPITWFNSPQFTGSSGNAVYYLAYWGHNCTPIDGSKDIIVNCANSGSNIWYRLPMTYVRTLSSTGEAKNSIVQKSSNSYKVNCSL